MIGAASLSPVFPEFGGTHGPLLLLALVSAVRGFGAPFTLVLVRSPAGFTQQLLEDGLGTLLTNFLVQRGIRGLLVRGFLRRRVEIQVQAATIAERRWMNGTSMNDDG